VCPSTKPRRKRILFVKAIPLVVTNHPVPTVFPHQPPLGSIIPSFLIAAMPTRLCLSLEISSRARRIPRSSSPCFGLLQRSRRFESVETQSQTSSLDRKRGQDASVHSSLSRFFRVCLSLSSPCFQAGYMVFFACGSLASYFR